MEVSDETSLALGVNDTDSLEHALDSTPIQRTSPEEHHNAAISLAEAALRRKWTDKYRDKQLRTALAALDLDHWKEEDGSNG